MEKRNTSPLRVDEGYLYLNTLGKIFFASCAAWLAGKLVSMNIRGTPPQVEAVAKALSSSKKFQDELNRPGATLETVIEKLKLKNMSAVEFERTLGIPWPL